MNNIDHKSLDYAVATDYLEDVLKRAENGDVMAARDVLYSIAHSLQTLNLNSDSGELLPVPVFICDYLSKAFYRMVAGESADKALNLKRAGRKNKNYYATRWAAYLVYQAVNENGMTVDEAVIKVAELINQKSAVGKLTWPLSNFGKQILVKESIQDWYYKHKEELEIMYENAKIKPDL